MKLSATFSNEASRRNPSRARAHAHADSAALTRSSTKSKGWSAARSLTEKGHEVRKRGLPLWDSVQHGIEENLGADKVRQLQRLLASL